MVGCASGWRSWRFLGLRQLNFYLEALDRDVKKPHENPSIGVLLCRDKDDEVVEYALSRNLSPALVAQYQLQLPDKKLLRSKLHELLNHQPDPNLKHDHPATHLVELVLLY